MFQVVSKTVWYISKSGETKYRYVLTDNVTAYSWGSLEYPIVFDTQFTDNVQDYKWYINRSGYAQKDDSLMHNLVFGGQQLTTGERRIVHLNGYKLDNRMCNLHLTSGKGIINDRTERIDKKPPPQELVDKGIYQLPRFVRWDNSEKKFIIQNHPTLQRDVQNRIRVRPILSGAKSAKIGIIEKYDDILIKLHNLNKLCPTFDESKLNVKDQLARQYVGVRDAIREFDGIGCV